MHSMLEAIVGDKYKEVKRLKAQGLMPLDDHCLKKLARAKSFRRALMGDGVSIIAEIKRKSPSKGFLCDIPNPSVLLEQYVQGGASAISVLTDKKYFSGSINDLKKISHDLCDSTMPVLRKDFILDPIQITESIVLGANAILLIVAVLQDKTATLLARAQDLGVDAIVEVHNKQELDLALACGADIIGINNRDLNDFSVDINNGLRLVGDIPDGVITVAESGIKTVEDMQRLQTAGFDAALIGESLLRSGNVVQMLHQLRGVPCQV